MRRSCSVQSLRLQPVPAEIAMGSARARPAPTLALKRTAAIADLRLHLAGSEQFGDSGLERPDALGIASHGMAGLVQEAIPVAAATALVGKARFLGTPELRQSVQERAVRAGMAAGLRIERCRVRCRRVEGGFPEFVRHMGYAIDVEPEPLKRIAIVVA